MIPRPLSRAEHTVARLPQRTVGVFIAALGLLAVAALTLTPQHGNDPTPAGWCLVCGDVGATDFALNIALFVPFGLGLRLAGVSRRHTLALVIATTLSVELLQLRLVSGRDASIGDITANSLGGAAGLLLAEHWRTLVLPSAAVARRLALAGGVLVLGTTAGTIWALTTSLPPSDYFGQLAPCLGGYGRFQGTIVGAELDAMPVPDGLLPGTARARLRGGHARLAATVIPMAPTDTLTPIVGIFDREQREILMLGQHGRDLVFRVRRHTGDARLRTPWIRVRDAFPAARTRQPRVMRLVAGVEGQRAYAADALEPQLAGVLVPAPALGWALLLPFDASIAEGERVVSLLWVTLLLLPVAYWAALWAHRAPRTALRARITHAAGIVGSTIALGLVVVPALFGVPAAHWSECAAAAAGAAAGWASGQRVARCAA